MPKTKKQQRLELLEVVLEGLRAAEKGAVVSHSRAMAELDKVLNA
jgi:predicted transcriptional regulator